MEAEKKICQNCRREFIIESEDFNFYEKIKVPPPTWCPECRLVRRLASVNTWSLHWATCEKCGKRTLSIFNPRKNVRVFCPPCWWSDSWDGTEYGIDYDPSKPFLKQVDELARKTPWVATESLYTSLKNSEYSNGIAWSKDCYMAFWADFCESVYYSSILNGLKYSSDCLRGWTSELCYGSTGFEKNYRTFFSDECNNCVDVWFSRNCYGCTNCVGCVNLRGAKNCIFNVQYSKEEYQKKLRELGFDSWRNLDNFQKKAHEFWLTKPYREYHGDNMNVNVTGEYTFESRNAKEGYIVNYTENSKYCQFITVATTKDCYDYSGWGNNAELIYESAVVGEGASNIKFSYYATNDLVNLEYCVWNTAAKNNFGCVNLKRKSYCILNKQYSKEEYEKLKARIIEDMKIRPYTDQFGRKFSYGEFFPPEMSKFDYNESNAMKFFPKTKEEALSMRYSWDDTKSSMHQTDTQSQDLPDTIKQTTDSILDRVVECSSCKRGYKIVQGELNLLRKMGLPVPHECPKCRENKRFARMTKPGMYHRTCDKCGVEIYTPYAPDDPRIVYCVKDYQNEFL